MPPVNPMLMTEQDIVANPMFEGMTGDQILSQIQPVSLDMPVEPMPEQGPMLQAPQELMAPQVTSVMPPPPPEPTGGFFENIAKYASQNAGNLIAGGLNRLNENYMTNNMSVDNYLKYLNAKNEREIADRRQVLDTLALEYDARYKEMDLQAKRENYALQRQMLLSNMAGQNIQNMIAMSQFDTQGRAQQAALNMGATPEEVTALGAEQAAKIALERQAGASEQEQSLYLVQKMKDYNEGTLDTPYAGVMQPLTRIKDPNAARDMALLQQTRLRIAAPLAKQLGVNPTDKDFENTLNQIFNENESKETRRAQLNNLEQIMGGGVKLNGVDEFKAFMSTPQGVDPRVWNKLTPEEQAAFTR